MAANLLELLEASVLAHFDRPALWSPEGQHDYAMWTYQEWWNDTCRVAGHLHEQGVRQHQCVGLLSTNRAWWPIADCAIMSIGACTVPIYPSLPSGQVEHIIRHSEMVGMFVEDRKQLQKLLDAPVDAFPNLRFVTVFASETEIPDEAFGRWSIFQYEDWRKTDVWDESRWRLNFASIREETLATIVYTSGTTGLPKGAMLTHGNLLANIAGIQEVVTLLPTDRTLSYLPLSHIFERTCGQFVILAVGGSIAYVRTVDNILEDFQRMPPTVFTTVPRLLEKLHEGIYARVSDSSRLQKRLFERAIQLGERTRVHGDGRTAWRLDMYDKLVFSRIRQVTGGRLRYVVVGGAALAPNVGRFFTALGIPIIEGYGMTETSPVIAVNPPSAPRIGTAGKVLPNVQAKQSEDGELLVKGPSVTPGYFKDEQATREAFTEDGWFRTGDIGEWTEDGYLRIPDRKKNLIVLSTGKKVTPAPVEAEIVNSPYIDQVLLVGQNRKFVSAIVVPNETSVLSWLKAQSGGAVVDWRRDARVEQLLLREIARCTTSFAAFEQPKQVIVAKAPFSVENGLLTPTLKVKPRLVTAMYANEINTLYENTIRAHE